MQHSQRERTSQGTVCPSATASIETAEWRAADQAAARDAAYGTPSATGPQIYLTEPTYTVSVSSLRQLQREISTMDDAFPLFDLPPGLLDRVVGCLELWDLAAARAACQTLPRRGRAARDPPGFHPQLAAVRVQHARPIRAGGTVRVAAAACGRCNTHIASQGARDARRATRAPPLCSRWPPALAEALPHGLPAVP
jgi:hypothetical protein